MSKAKQSPLVRITLRHPSNTTIECYANCKIQIKDKKGQKHHLDIGNIKSIEDLRPRIDYDTYINSPEWEARKQAFRRDHPEKNQCLLCGDKYNLNIHHVTYANLCNERDNDLECLCKDCHTKLHDAVDKVNSGENIYIALRQLSKEVVGVPSENVKRAAYVFMKTSQRRMNYKLLMDYIAVRTKAPAIFEDKATAQIYDMTRAERIEELIESKAELQAKVDNLTNELTDLKAKQEKRSITYLLRKAKRLLLGPMKA